MKISFHAFIKNETILEFWLKAIERSILFLVGSGQLPTDECSLKAQLTKKLEDKFALTLLNVAKI